MIVAHAKGNGGLGTNPFDMVHQLGAHGYHHARLRLGHRQALGDAAGNQHTRYPHDCLTTLKFESTSRRPQSCFVPRPPPLAYAQ